MRYPLQNGHVLSLSKTKRVQVVPNLKLENQGDCCYLMLGEDQPELAIELSMSNIEALIEGLQKHAKMLADTSSRLILPGDSHEAV